MKPVQYIFLNKGVGMSTGKAAAQAAHAAVQAVAVSDASLVRKWNMGGHYTKLVMEAADAAHLQVIERYITDRGFKTELIIDEGHTELPPFTPTALGVEIVDKDSGHAAATFGEFKLYRESPPKYTTEKELPEWPLYWMEFLKSMKVQSRA